MLKRKTAKHSRPTPRVFKKIFDVIFYISSLAAFIIPMLTNLSEHTLLEIGRWSVGIVAILKFTIVYFRWDYQPIDKDNEDDDDGIS